MKQQVEPGECRGERKLGREEERRSLVPQASEALGQSLDFFLSVVRRHWRFLNRKVT